jgi:hypothetical protein
MDLVHFSRVKTLASLYFKQAEKSYLEFLRLSKDIFELSGEDDDSDTHEIKEACSLAGIQTIVFSAMCVEAGAYDYAAVHLGDEYALQHLDKLDIISKWLISLRLISHYELPKSSATFGSLKRLVRARNKLAHVKSEEFDFESPAEQYARIERESEQLRRDVHESYRCLALMSITFQRFAPAAAYHLPWRFIEAVMNPDPIPEQLRAIVTECRGIVRALAEG